MTYGTATPPEKNANSLPPEHENALPPRPVWVYSAFVFTLLFMGLHVYWAVGGTWGLPLLALHNKAAVQSVNWVISAIMLIGAFFVLALNHPVARRVPSWLLLTPLWIGSIVCLSHAVFGFVTKSLYLSGRHGAVDFPVVPGVSAETAAEKNHLAAVHDLLVFEPSFLVQGLLLAMVGWQFLRTSVGRRKWTWSVVAGVAVVDVFGVLLTLADLQFALA